MSGEQGQRSPSSRVSRTGTLVVTNAIKLAGAVLGFHEGFTTKDSGVLLFAGLLIVGAQGFEGMVLAVVDRVLGRESKG